jgi:TetR/AcrR family fatty acid metabolism transcriptional regulator
MSKKKTGEKYYKIIEAATKIFAIYFENKDDILISLFEEQMKGVLDNMVVQILGQNDPIKKLEKFALTHLQLIEQNKAMAEIIQVEVRQSSKFMKEYNNEQFARYLDLIGDIIQEGKEVGCFKEDVIPGVAKRAFFGALDEMSRYWVLSSRKWYDINTTAKQISAYFLNGIKV